MTTTTTRLLRLLIGMAALALSAVLLARPAFAAPLWVNDQAGIVDDQYETVLTDQINELRDTYNLGVYIMTFDAECDDLDQLVEDRMFESDAMDSGTREDVFMGVAPGCKRPVVTFFITQDEPVFNPEFTDWDQTEGVFADVDEVHAYLNGALSAIWAQVYAVKGMPQPQEPATPTTEQTTSPEDPAPSKSAEQSTPPLQPVDDPPVTADPDAPPKSATKKIETKHIGAGIGIAGALGALISWGITSNQKSKHDSALMQSAATHYLREKSLQMVTDQDNYVRSDTTSRPAPTGRGAK